MKYKKQLPGSFQAADFIKRSGSLATATENSEIISGPSLREFELQVRQIGRVGRKPQIADLTSPIVDVILPVAFSTSETIDLIVFSTRTTGPTTKTIRRMMKSSWRIRMITRSQVLLRQEEAIVCIFIRIVIFFLESETIWQSLTRRWGTRPRDASDYSSRDQPLGPDRPSAEDLHLSASDELWVEGFIVLAQDIFSTEKIPWYLFFLIAAVMTIIFYILVQYVFKIPLELFK
jgi:hypothetical protein